MSFSLKFDHSKPGLQKVFKEYQELALRYVWEVGETGVGSRKIWETVSRASIIMFLEKLRKKNFLGPKAETGKGGYRRIYYPRINEDGFVKFLLRTIVESMRLDFPDVTTEVIMSYVEAHANAQAN